MTRAELILGALVAVLATYLAWSTFKANPWKARAVTGETQATLNGTTGAIADKAGQQTVRIITQSESLAHAVEVAPGADTPVPPAVLDGWRAGVVGLRERPSADPSGDTAQPPS